MCLIEQRYRYRYWKPGLEDILYKHILNIIFDNFLNIIQYYKPAYWLTESSRCSQLPVPL